MIELRALSKHYRQGKTTVLSDVTLSLESGSSLAILGRSGCGKTTLMNLMGLLDVPDSGSYLLDGRDVTQLSANQRASLRKTTFGFIFQHFFLLPRLSVLDNVALPLVYQGVSLAKQKVLVTELLTKVGMEDYIQAKPTELSGGQQQRVAIARALVAKPRVILADEPTGALDSSTGVLVMDLLMQLQQEMKTTVVVVTHDLQVAEYCQQKIEMQDGKMHVKDAVT
jgi:putative ABC transport system ATP-binding protein